MQIVKKTTQRCKLKQLKAKILLEEISEHILKQDARYRHYGNNLEQIVVKEESLARKKLRQNRKHGVSPDTSSTTLTS